MLEIEINKNMCLTVQTSFSSILHIIYIITCTIMKQKGWNSWVAEAEIKVKIPACLLDGQDEMHCIYSYSTFKKLNSPSLSLLHTLSSLTVDAWLISTRTLPLTYNCPTCVSLCWLTHIPTDPVIYRLWPEPFPQEQQEAGECHFPWVLELYC